MLKTTKAKLLQYRNEVESMYNKLADMNRQIGDLVQVEEDIEVEKDDDGDMTEAGEEQADLVESLESLSVQIDVTFDSVDDLFEDIKTLLDNE